MDTVEWMELRTDEVGVALTFFGEMMSELASNAHKGDRPGWLSMTSRDAISEVLYHAAKLAYATRQFEQGDGTPEKVREFAADVANCAMMVADIAGVLPDAPRITA